MIFLLVIHLLLSASAAALIQVSFTQIAALSFLAGAGTSFLSILSLVIAWPFFLTKKLFALSIGVIVLKFAILAWILSAVVSSKSILIHWYAVGLGLVVVSVVATAYRYAHSEHS